MIEAAFTLQRGNFTLDIEGNWQGGRLGIFGTSGAGKTCFLRMLCGLERPVRGRLQVGDVTLFDTAKRIWVPPHRRRFATVFQDDRLFPHLSIRENLVYGFRRLPRRERRIALDEVIAALELEPFLARRPAQLSGGQRQRVSLGRALLCSPRLLLCDEPLSALDAPSRQSVLRYLLRVQETFAIPLVYVSHEMSELQTLCEEIIVLREGRVRASGAFANLVRDADILKRELNGTVTNVWVGRLEQPPAEGEGTVFRTADETAPALDVGSTVATDAGPCVLMLPAGSVAVARGPLPGLSIRNRLSGTVVHSTTTRGRVLLEVDCGLPVFARITERSCRELNLAPGQRIQCVFKCSSLHLT